MAVEAVVSVVIQKITDFQIHESIIFDKVVDQVEDIRLELRRMRGFLKDAEGRQKNDGEAKKWVQQYLETIYNVEDMIESYVLRLVIKQTNVSLFQNYGFHFHDLKACKKLRWKLKQIEEKIKKLNDEMPDKIEDASLRSFSFSRESKQLNTSEQISEIPSDASSSTSNLRQTKQMLSISNKEGSDFVGFKYEKKVLEKRLTNEDYKMNGYSTRMSNEDCTQPLSQDNPVSMFTKIWLLSYNDLPAHYKLCLLYLTLFPEEYDLSVRRIIRLWLAEGFLQRPPGLGLGEDLAEECFNDLVKRNLIKVSKLRSDGGPRKCHLPGFLRELLSPFAHDISLFHIHQTSQSPPSINPSEVSEQKSLPKPGVRRIVEYADIPESCPDNIFQNLRSYLSFNIQRYDIPAKGVGKNLSKIIGTKGFGLLRVLDLEGIYKPLLPTTLKHLFQLRYLGLRWTFLDSLPNSVGDLPYLETLDLKRTYIYTLPSSVWKLKRLRHLYLPEVRLDTRMQKPSSQLLTLWGLIIDDDCNMTNGLNILCDLRELGITCQLKIFDELMSWITSLTHLQSLNLTSKNEMGCPSNLHLKSLSALVKLSRIELLGKLGPRLNKDQFPPYLRVLTLSFSHLEVDPMEILSQLQSLSVLRLQAKSYIGKTMNCPQDGFPNLRVLKLWMLNELKEWMVQEGAMPSIKELNIRFCQKLKEIPLILMKRTKLDKLIVTSMPEEFEKYVRKNISDHTLLEINSYDFTPLPWDNDPDLWQEDCQRVNHIN